MIDTHTHIYFPDFKEDIQRVINRAMDEGVKAFILPNVDQESFEYMIALHKEFPDNTYMAMGLHPTEVKEDFDEFIKFIDQELSSGKYVAVGEVGMDLYWDKSYIDLQKKAFEDQLKLAQKYNLPVIIHSRDALEETLEVIEKIKPVTPLVFHSFTGNKKDVEKIRKICDPYFGINGVVTYKNASELREALKEIGIDHILLETDSPYLTPVPHRGKRNESSFISHVRNKVAESLSIAPEEVERFTDNNARRVFAL